MSESNAKIVSLVDKQLAMAQKRHEEMEQALSEVMAAIEDNARLQLNLHDLTLEVMRAADLATALSVLISGLKQRFDLKDVQVWGQFGSSLPQPIPTESVMQFMHYMQGHPLVSGLGSTFPIEVWQVARVVSGCAFALRGRQGAYGVVLMGRKDDVFAQEIDTLFLQQFVDIMGLYLERL
jgi:uncharacterized protein YigA (DUF484 family)